MTSIIKADNISTVAGTGTISVAAGNSIESTEAGGIKYPGGVLQVYQHIIDVETAFTSTSYVDVNNSQFTMTAVGTNSKFVITYIGQSYKSGTNDGFGLQLYRVSPNETNLWTPYSTWGAQGHDATNSNAESIQLQYLDSPGITAGSTVTYKFRVAKYSAGTGYINYGAPGSTWSGYANKTNIIVWEIAQ